MTAPAFSAPAAAPRATAASAARVVTLTRLLARPSRQGRAALVLPVVAFAVTTALLLIVAGGVRMFLTDPRAATNAEMYAPLSIFALVLLAVPIATLGAAAARLSARRRNDRLATLRLLGATSGEVGVMTVLEAAATAAIGALCGVVLFIALLPAVGLLPFFGGSVGAAALWTGPAIAASAVGAVVVLATASAAVSLRRVRLTPLGVRRRTDPPPRRTALLVGCGILIVVVALAASQFGAIGNALGSVLGPIAIIGFLFGLFAVSLLLVNAMGAPLVAARGRAMARSASSASRLIAGRELAAHAAVAWRRVSGIAMISFIAVVGGAGASLATILGDDAGAGAAADATLFADMRTGVLVTLGAGFVLLACSVGLTQAASVLEDRELIIGLDRLGMPADQLQKARSLTVMVPLRWAALGGAAVGGVLAFPFVGAAVLFAPVSLVIIAGTFAVGILIVWLSVRATTPIVAAIRRSA
ncbi:MAG: permease [Microbacterium sp.]|uniref:FtsX-like permease family protein n=1 Tax=Microbacterium sp. TaxID=51671 RepID=UPI001AD47B97|nr:FtsX-like permease family protein [Microbacterium sp.]MBN9178117.1 permease [Microbacterium sp.]